MVIKERGWDYKGYAENIVFSLFELSIFGTPRNPAIHIALYKCTLMATY